MPPKKLTTVTFSVLKDMTDILFRKQNKKNYSEVQQKVAEYFVENGNDNFIAEYNELILTNNYIKTLDKLKL
jgi:hypothetical protein